MLYRHEPGAPTRSISRPSVSALARRVAGGATRRSAVSATSSLCRPSARLPDRLDSGADRARPLQGRPKGPIAHRRGCLHGVVFGDLSSARLAETAPQCRIGRQPEGLARQEPQASRAGRTTPVTPFLTTSRTDPTSVATTGTSQARDSGAVVVVPSERGREVTRVTSSAA